MNRLWVRITAALVGVTLLSVVTVTVLTQVNTSAQMMTLSNRQREIAQVVLLDTLVEYYTLTGGWDGVEHVLTAALPNFSQLDELTARGGRPMRRMRSSVRFVLADTEGYVISFAGAAPRDARFDQQEMRASSPVEVDGRIVGYLLADSPQTAMLSEAQQMVLDQLLRYAVVSALVVGLAAALVGVVTGRALAAPLADLAETARQFSRRRWDARARERGAQEVIEVAQSFNRMATSLERSEIERRNLTADIAHELRTPLTVIQGNLRAMLDGVYPLERAEIATIYDETRLLSRLVEDLRLLALAEAGQLQLRMQEESAQALVRAATAQYQLAAEAASVRLESALSGDELFVSADADRAGQVLRNLLSNALRYTPAGGVIRVRVERVAGGVRFAVSDTGSGIAADVLPHIFDRFYRGDAARTRTGGGTGLGLAIVQGLVQAMGGRVGAESTPGMGSTLWFELEAASVVRRQTSVIG